MIFQSDNLLERESELLRYVHSLAVDGVLLSVTEETKDVAHIEEIRQTGTPILLIDKLTGTSNLPGVSINGFDAAYRGAGRNYLAEHGHRKLIGIFGNPSLTMTVSDEELVF